MSMIRFTCPVCNTTVKAREALYGKRSPCPVCGQCLQVPATTDKLAAPHRVPEETAPSSPDEAPATGHVWLGRLLAAAVVLFMAAGLGVGVSLVRGQAEGEPEPERIGNPADADEDALAAGGS